MNDQPPTPEPTDHDHGRDQPPTDHATTPAWMTMEAAADQLGITVNAVRQRIKRGTLLGEKTDAGWLVDLSGADHKPTTPTNQTTDHQPTTDQKPDTDVLVEHLRSEVDYLRSRLEEEHQQRERMLQQMASERERFDVIHRTALGRIEALTPTVGAQSDHQDTTETVSGAVGSPESDERGLQGLKAWLRRLLGG